METNNINVHKVSVYKPDSPIKQKYNILSNEEVCKNTTALINEKNKKWQDFLNKYKEESLHYLIQQFNNRNYFENVYEYYDIDDRIDTYKYRNSMKTKIIKKCLEDVCKKFNYIFKEHGYKVSRLLVNDDYKIIIITKKDHIESYSDKLYYYYKGYTKL